MDGRSTPSAELPTRVQLEGIQIVNYMVVASMTLLIYDYCLTLVDEIFLIWNSKINVVKILYFLSRYPAFVDVALTVYIHVAPNVPINHCLPANSASVWLTMIGISVAELILILRTFALWSGNKKILYGLLSLFTAFFIASLAITGIFVNAITVIPYPLPSMTGCTLIGAPPIVFFNFVILIIFETVIMGITAFRGYRKFRGTTNPLINTLYRDGIMFYICLFAISLSNIFVLSLGSRDFVDLITTFQRTMHSILSCRIVTHARRIDRRLNATSLTAMNPGKQLEPDFFTTVIMEPDISIDLLDNNGRFPDRV